MNPRVETVHAPLDLSPAQRALIDERLQRARRIVAQWAQNGGRRPQRGSGSLPTSARRETSRHPRHAVAGALKPHDPLATKRALVAVLEGSVGDLVPSASPAHADPHPAGRALATSGPGVVKKHA